jgi:hypothetical protein
MKVGIQSGVISGTDCSDVLPFLHSRVETLQLLE